MNTATILASIRDLIEGLTPADQASDDDVYRVLIDVALAPSPPTRTVLLSAQGGIRSVGKVQFCGTWETQITLSVFYRINTPEQGQQGTLEIALTDSEDILEALYVWASTAGIRIEPNYAQAQDQGDGTLEIERGFTIRFERS